MSKEQELIYKMATVLDAEFRIDERSVPKLEELLKEYAKEQKTKLLWEMIDEWQSARDGDDPEYLSKERFSFMDIENDFYEKLQKIDPLQPTTDNTSMNK